MKSFTLEAIQKSDCPNLWHDLLAAGKYTNGRIEVPAAAADAILARCPGAAAAAIRGLGDVVAMVAQPIARAIDAVAGTNLKTCGGCAQRRAALNSAVPFRPQ